MADLHPRILGRKSSLMGIVANAQGDAKPIVIERNGYPTQTNGHAGGNGKGNSSVPVSNNEAGPSVPAPV